MKSLTWKKITVSNSEYYIITHGKTKVSVSYLPLILTLTGKILNVLNNEYHGKILMHENKNLIVFNTEENAKDAAEWLNSVIISNKLSK